MSALQRLKAKLVVASARTSEGSEGGPSGPDAKFRAATRFEGFKGSPTTPIPADREREAAFEGFKGDPSRGISGFLPVEHVSNSEKGLPDHPSKPPKVALLQTDLSRCWVCTHVEKLADGFVAICSDVPGEHYWMHRACWPEHVRRVAEARKQDVGACLVPGSA